MSDNYHYVEAPSSDEMAFFSWESLLLGVKEHGPWSKISGMDKARDKFLLRPVDAENFKLGQARFIASVDKYSDDGGGAPCSIGIFSVDYDLLFYLRRVSFRGDAATDYTAYTRDADWCWEIQYSAGLNYETNYYGIYKDHNHDYSNLNRVIRYAGSKPGLFSPRVEIDPTEEIFKYEAQGLF